MDGLCTNDWFIVGFNNFVNIIQHFNVIIVVFRGCAFKDSSGVDRISPANKCSVSVARVMSTCAAIHNQRV